MTGVVAAIPDRRISQAIAQKYGVTVEYNAQGQIVKHHYPYHDKDSGTPTGTKVRIVDNKSFYATGEFGNVGLFGQQAFKGGGKYITITEGEADALAVHEMFTKCSTGNGPLSPLEVAQAEHQRTLKKTLSG